MHISSATTSYLSSLKQKNCFQNSNEYDFHEALEAEQAVSNNQSINKSNKPSYMLTNEEAEYFREKYGEEYNENEPFKFFDELASKNIISVDDAHVASRKNVLARVEGFMPEKYENNLELYNILLRSGQETVKVKYEKAVYGDSYEKYKNSCENTLTTWLDYVNDNYSYYKFISENYDVILNSDGVPYIEDAEELFTGYCGQTEKVRNVLLQIFG